MHADGSRNRNELGLTAVNSKASSLSNRGDSKPEGGRLRSILCQLGILASLGMVLASCGGGGATMGAGTRQLIGVSVQPGSGQAVAPNGTEPFNATGTFDQAPTTQTSLQAQWASSDPTIASIDPNTGIATCLVAGGPVTVTASAAGKGGTVQGSGTLTCQLSAPLSMQGSWTFLFHSAVSDGCFVLEANLSEAGNHVFSDRTSTLVFDPTMCSQSTIVLQLKQLGGQCDRGSVGEVSVDATLFSSDVSLALSEAGALGSVVTTVSASNNGGSISNGTYTTPAACGFPEDHGSVEGYQFPIAFSGETYAGTLTFDGTAHTIVSHFASVPHTLDLSMSGTCDGTSFVLSGSTTGWSLNLTGTIAGETVHWFGLYDPLYNDFLIYDSGSTFVGGLSHSPLNNPGVS